MRTRVLLLTVLLCTGAFAAEIDWPSIRLTQLSATPFAPVQITHAGDGSGRLFIVDRSGIIWLHEDGQLVSARFLSIEDRVLGSRERSVSEQGLLGIAFPPDFVSKHCFYVNYTRRSDGATLISRFFVSENPSVANPRSEEILLTIQQPSPVHNGGQLAFGPDGYLYIGMGDGGPLGDPNNIAQNPDSLLGKMLRIDVESSIKPYGLPADNPFLKNLAYRPEIWAAGLRNPWRFSFDRLTGDLYIGDVGAQTREEINFQPRASRGGENYGWRIKEGNIDFKVPPGFDFSVLTPPIVDYGRDQGFSVTGGFVYRGANSLRMRGMYIYGDFGSGRIWALHQADGKWLNQQIASTLHRICSFGEDEAGELYLADYRGGQIYRIEDSGTVGSPIFSPTGGTVPIDQVTLTTGSSRAKIYYTTDGRDPTEADVSLDSGGTITIVTGTTLKARAYRPDLPPSEIASATYVLQAATPAFEPASGTSVLVTNSVTVSITCATPQALIRYTLDDTEPSLTSTLYTGSFSVQGGTAVRARAFRDGFRDSNFGFATYPHARVASPVLDPPPGSILKGTPVTIRSQAGGAVIRYALNSEMPTLDSAIYSGPLVFTQRFTILQAQAFQDGFKPSPVAYGAYQWTAVETPRFTPDGGITNGTPVKIECSTPGAVIRYTLDGTEPTTFSPRYTEPFSINPGITLAAKAFKDGYVDSSTASAYYFPAAVLSPDFSPFDGPLTNHTLVSITARMSGAVIYYTLDGSEPTDMSPRYTAPISVTPPLTLKAKGMKPGYVDSSVRTTEYGLIIYEDTEVTTLAGPTANFGGAPGFSDGIGSSAKFFRPNSITIGLSGALFVADSYNNRIRRISPDGTVTTYAGSGVGGFRDGIGLSAQFNNPQWVASDAAGNLFVVDASNYRIRRISPSQEVSTIAGSGVLGLKDGFAREAQFLNPRQIVVDSLTNLFILDVVIRKLSSVGEVTSLPRGTFQIEELMIDFLDNLVVSGYSKLWKFDSKGTFTEYAGTLQGFADGMRSSARFSTIGSLATDRLNNIYLSDQFRIRKIRADGFVTTLAGAGRAGNQNGPGPVAEFLSIRGICVDKSGIVYMVDSGNNSIRKIIQKDWDGDGIPDSQEGLQTPYVVGVDDRLVDTDTDGVSNTDEFAAGTDPRSPPPLLSIDGITVQPDGRVSLSWKSLVGFSYQLQRSVDLITWIDTGAQVIGNGELLSTHDPEGTGEAAGRFYRLRGQRP